MYIHVYVHTSESLLVLLSFILTSLSALPSFVVISTVASSFFSLLEVGRIILKYITAMISVMLKSKRTAIQNQRGMKLS